jgi:hypothetical protein
VLREALTARADPLHLALVFGLAHTTVGKYTLIACALLAEQSAEAAGEQHYAPANPRGVPDVTADLDYRRGRHPDTRRARFAGCKQAATRVDNPSLAI